LINAEHEEQAEPLGKISAALCPIEEEHLGHIPKSVLSDAMLELRLEKCAEDWLSKRGQYYCKGQHQTPD